MAPEADRVAVVPLERGLLDGVPTESGRAMIDLAVLPVFGDERPLQGLAGFLDWRSSGALSQLVRDRLCTGEDGEAVLMPARFNLPLRRVVVLGLGALVDFDQEAAVAMARRVVGVARRLQPDDVLVAMPGPILERRVLETAFETLARSIAASRVTESGPTQRTAPAAESSGSTADHTGVDNGRSRCRTWWVVVDERHVARLRRVLEGPPRAADPG